MPSLLNQAWPSKREPLGPAAATSGGGQSVLLRRDTDSAYLMKPSGRWYVGLGFQAVGALAGGIDALTVDRRKLGEENVGAIRATRYKVAAYVIASLLAGLGGILLASRIGSSQVNAGGGYLMDAVAAAWIGFSLAGSGKPNALGTLVGAVILGVLSNGLVMLSVPYYAMDIIKGLVLAVALAITYIQKR